MKSFNLNAQSGAVLAFCLVMLLLLTISGTRMIQQNKQQLQMATNMRDATQKFADAEAVLAEAKSVINAQIQHNNDISDYFDATTKLSIYNPKHQCTPLATVAPYKQNISLAGTVTGMPNSTVLTVYCLSPYQKCTSYDKATGTLTCHPKSGDVNCTGKTVEEVAALFTHADDVCYQMYDPLCAEDLSTTTNPRCVLEPPKIIPPPACPKEVYKLDVIATDATGATREIISDHVVGCGT